MKASVTEIAANCELAVLNPSRPGKLPSRLNTVKSDVLASLLESAVPSGMDAVFNQNTTRLSAVIHSLKNDFGWNIESSERAVNTKDGRIAFVSYYWLSQATISAAFSDGAEEWVKKVRTARTKQRRQSAKCKAKAESINARQKNNNPRQGELWLDTHAAYSGHETIALGRAMATHQIGAIDMALAGLLSFAILCMALLGGHCGF